MLPRAEPTDPELRIGNYKVIRRLAVGGMAEIYLVRAEGLEGFAKTFVLKKILPQHAGHPAFVDMFLNEARIGASLHHPNIAQVFAIERTEEGDYVLVMEYLEGADLCAVIAACPQGLKLPHLLTIGSSVASALHYAHHFRGSTDGASPASPIVHRDVSPSNIVVTHAGAIKLLDFGIASAASTGVQQTGSLKGKLAYMAPEQATQGKLDGRTDLFALSIVLYELATGRHPFDPAGDAGLAVVERILRTEAPDPREFCPDLPAELVHLLKRGLERDPDRRYQSGDAMRRELEHIGRSQGAILSGTNLASWWLEQARQPSGAAQSGFNTATKARWKTVLFTTRQESQPEGQRPAGSSLAGQPSRGVSTAQPNPWVVAERHTEPGDGLAATVAQPNPWVVAERHTEPGDGLAATVVAQGDSATPTKSRRGLWVTMLGLILAAAVVVAGRWATGADPGAQTQEGQSAPICKQRRP